MASALRMTSWLEDHLSPRLVVEFLTEFAGERIPKPTLFEREEMHDRAALLAGRCAAATGGVLTKADAIGIAKQLGCSHAAVRWIFNRRRREIVDRLIAGELEPFLPERSEAR